MNRAFMDSAATTQRQCEEILKRAGIGCNPIGNAITITYPDGTLLGARIGLVNVVPVNNRGGLDRESYLVLMLAKKAFVDVRDTEPGRPLTVVRKKILNFMFQYDRDEDTFIWRMYLKDGPSNRVDIDFGSM